MITRSHKYAVEHLPVRGPYLCEPIKREKYDGERDKKRPETHQCFLQQAVFHAPSPSPLASNRPDSLVMRMAPCVASSCSTKLENAFSLSPTSTALAAPEST